MTMTFTQLLVLFAALVSLFSPLANIGPFAALVGHFLREDQRKLACGVFVNVLAIAISVQLVASGLRGLFPILGG